MRTKRILETYVDLSKVFHQFTCTNIIKITGAIHFYISVIHLVTRSLCEDMCNVHDVPVFESE